MPARVLVRLALGARVRDARKALFLTQFAVATSLGWSQSFYSRVETGSTSITFEQFLALCVVLQMQPAHIASSVYSDVA